jgi:hypothetical protein
MGSLRNMKIRIPCRKVGIISFELHSMRFQDGLEQPECRRRRKIRLKKSNVKCRYLKKLTCKGTLRQVFYLSEDPLPSCDPIHLNTCILYTVLIHTGGELTRKKGRGASWSKIPT